MITYYASKKFLELLTGQVSTAQFSTAVYAGLSLTANVPLAGGTGYVEPSGNGYARVLIGNPSQALTHKMSLAVDGATSNDEVIFFPEALGAWGECNYFLVFDSPTGGNLLAFGTLTAPITPTNATVPLVRVGELDITLS